jgi:carbamoyltransferase
MTAILGLNFHHADSAACLVIDGKLVGAVAEERLGPREKHSSRFPENAVRWLLSANNVKAADLTHVALPRDTRANRRAKAAWVARHPVHGTKAAMEHFRRARQSTSLVDRLAWACGEQSTALRFERVDVEHHLAHVASAYYLSGFDDLTAGFSYDASGDFASAMAARCEGHRIAILDRVLLPDSLGFFYTALCQFIGFDSFGEEYKVMGLAPYGQDAYADLMARLVRLPREGWYGLAPGYFGMHEGGSSGGLDEDGRLVMGRFWTDALTQELGDPAERGVIGQREKDIACSTQRRFEQAALHCLERLHRLLPTDQLVMAGGCALNGVANAQISRETPFRATYLQPAASDDGTCLGAAFWAWHNVVGSRERFRMDHAFWGPGYSDSRHRQAVEGADGPVVEYSSDAAAADAAAELIAEGRVIGWYQGRSEWGPRALGHRSILANPGVPGMKDIINAKIKRRESFRPFAPSVLREEVQTYFEQDVHSPFMMHVVKVRSEWRERLPAVTHVDGTGRLQSVDRGSNALYHHLISQVKKRTGIGVVLNTSFNENEPIVDTPEQAVACFLRTDLDALVVGRYILNKLHAAA